MIDFNTYLVGRLKLCDIKILTLLSLSFTIFLNIILSFIFRFFSIKNAMDDIYIENTWVKLIIFSVIIAPIVEEIFFRGFLFEILIRLIKNINVIVFIISLVFALYHWNLIQGIYAFIFSIGLTAVRIKYESLLSCIYVHFIANSTACFFTYINALNYVIDRPILAFFILVINFMIFIITIRYILNSIK